MTPTCPFCELLRAPRSDPTFVVEFEHSVGFLNFDQETYLGQAILVLKEHHDHLHLTPIPLQQSMVVELTAFTSALLKAFGGIRANHQSLGNQVSHVHWHVVPRYPGDPNSGGEPQWILPFSKLSDVAYRQLASRVQAVLKQD